MARKLFLLRACCSANLRCWVLVADVDIGIVWRSDLFLIPNGGRVSLCRERKWERESKH